MKITCIQVVLVAIAVVILGSCTNNKQEQTKGEKEKNSIKNAKQDTYDDPKLPFDQRLKKYIEGKLSTRPNEDYRLQIYEEHLNDDGKMDMVITVNRLENAIKTAEEKHLVTKSATVGFFGNHNHLFYYSSITNKFMGPYTMSSTPQRQLTITFENISSENHKDIIVDFPIRNSQFRRIYLMMDDTPNYVFQWKQYDGWGTDNLEAYCFEYGKGTYSETKDIIINKAEMKNIGKDDNYDTAKQEITCTNQLVKRFFFNAPDRKYYTPN